MSRSSKSIIKQAERGTSDVFRVVEDVLAKHNVSVPELSSDSIKENVFSRVADELESFYNGSVKLEHIDYQKGAAHAVLNTILDSVYARQDEVANAAIGNEPDVSKRRTAIAVYVIENPDSECAKLYNATSELVTKEDAVEAIKAAMFAENELELSTDEMDRSPLVTQMSTAIQEFSENPDYADDEYLNDMIDMEESIQDPKSYMDNEYSKFNELLPSYADMLSVGQAAIVDTGVEQRVDAKVLNNAELREIMKTDAPFQYMASITKEAVNEVKDAIKNVFKVEGTRACRMLDELSLVKLHKTHEGNILAPAIESGLSLLNSMNRELTATVGKLYQDAAEMLEHTNEMVRDFKSTTMEAVNRSMELATGGRWSQYQAAVELGHAQKVFNNKENAIDFINKHLGKRVADAFDIDNNGKLHAKYELNTFGKLAKSVIDKISDIQLAGTFDATHKDATADLGTYTANRANYWTFIKQEVWKGEPSPAEKLDDWIDKKADELGEKADTVRSAVENKLEEVAKDIAAGYKKADTFVTEKSTALETAVSLKAYEFGYAVQNLPSTAKATVNNVLSKAATKIGKAAFNIEGEAHNISAFAMEQMAKILQKYANRIINKVTQLENVDKKIFDSMETIKKEMNSLTEITPYQKREYTPDPNIAATISMLKESMNMPGADKNIAQAYIDILEKRIEKEKAKFEKTEAKIESELGDSLKKQAGSLSADFLELKAKQVDNLEKKENALALFFKVNSMIERLQSKADEQVMKAMSSKREAVQMPNEQEQDGQEYDD